MIELCLKAEDDASLIEALSFARSKDEDDNDIWITDTHSYSLVIIGTLYNKDEVYSEETGEIATPPTTIDGYHADIRCNQEISSLIPLNIVIEVADESRRYKFA